MMKRKIIKELHEDISRLETIIDCLDNIEADNPADVRAIRFTLVTNLFELVDSIGTSELNIYNYLEGTEDDY